MVKIRRKLLLATLWAPYVAYGRPSPFVDLKGAPTALSPAEINGLFRQCSRPAPRPDRVLGAPSKTEIERLERGLESFIFAENEAGRRVPDRGVPYARQYAAFSRKGRRLIYGSFFPAEVGLPPPPGPAGKAIIWCDGGGSVWGVVYDPGRDRYSDLQINGFA